MEKKKLNIKVKIAVGIIIFIVVLFIGSFVYYKQAYLLDHKKYLQSQYM